MEKQELQFHSFACFVVFLFCDFFLLDLDLDFSKTVRQTCRVWITVHYHIVVVAVNVVAFEALTCAHKLVVVGPIWRHVNASKSHFDGKTFTVSLANNTLVVVAVVAVASSSTGQNCCQVWLEIFHCFDTPMTSRRLKWLQGITL